MGKSFITTIILTVLFLGAFSKVIYPKNENIESFPKDDEPKSIDITSTNDLKSYLKNYDYVIAVFHMDWCGHCRHFIPIFDQASSYHMVKKWKFLKINCNHKEICSTFGVDRFPTIKIFDKGNQLKAEPQRELGSLLEFLEKVSIDPIIKVQNVTKFLNEYGTFSPYVEFDDVNAEFIACVSMLAKTEFVNTYYFGIKPINVTETHKQKIVFDFDKMNITYEWDGECENVKTFLEQNTYPLLSQIDVTFIRKLQKNAKTTFMLFYNENNENQKNFIKNSLKKISYRHRNIVFGYLDPAKDQYLASHFKIKTKPGMQIVIYNFAEEMYYIHPNELDITNHKDNEIEKEIEGLFTNMPVLPFSTGNFFNDFLVKIGLKKIIPYLKYIFLLGVIAFVLILIIVIILCDKEEEVKEEKKEKKE